MSRIAACLSGLAEKNKKALVPYVVSGDPHPTMTVPIMHALVASGADIIELGIPFSDPMAEGPVIQLAHERALVHNVSLKDTLAMVQTFRQENTTTPVVLMGYANPIEVMGYDNFASMASACGVDGMLTVDLPPEEATDFHACLQQYGLDNIYLVAPTTEDKRIQSIAKLASGYLYYVSLKGVTGAGNLDIASVAERLSVIKSITDLPVCVGFGIKDASSAQQIAALAEGAVVGSAIVDKIRHASSVEEAVNIVKPFVASLRQAIDK